LTSSNRKHHRIAESYRSTPGLANTLFIISIILFLSFQLAVAAEFRQVKVGSDEHFPVIFQNPDGVAQDLYVDLLREIGREDNLRFEYVFGTWDNILQLVTI
jgi:hypothetical protein